jgi:TRAP-type C4-dicarboxylate transport system permease small subunit
MVVIKKLFHHCEEFICCAALIVIASSVFAQVVARYVFEVALHWTEEVASIAMVWAVYMGASLCVRERFHIRILIVVKSLPLNVARFVIFLADILWMLFCIFMLFISWSYLGVMWRFPTISPSLGLDQFYPQMIVFIGYGMMSLRLVETYWLWYQNGATGLPGMLNEDEHSTVDELELKL